MKPLCLCPRELTPSWLWAHRSQTSLYPQKLEEQDRRALSIKEQLQREHRFLKRRLEQLSVQSVERVRTDSTGSAVSTDDSEQGECLSKQGRSWAAQSWPLGVGICSVPGEQGSA